MSYFHLFHLSPISSQSVFLLLICPPPQDEFQISAWQTPWPPRQQAAGTGYASPSCPSRQFECAAPADTSTRSSCGRRRPAAEPRPCRPPGPPGRSSSPSPSAGAHSSLGTPYPGHYMAEKRKLIKTSASVVLLVYFICRCRSSDFRLTTGKPRWTLPTSCCSWTLWWTCASCRPGRDRPWRLRRKAGTSRTSATSYHSLRWLDGEMWETKGEHLKRTEIQRWWYTHVTICFITLKDHIFVFTGF